MNLVVIRNLPPENKKRELVNALMKLNHGDSTYLSYSEYTKTNIGNCIASARIRIGERKIVLRTQADKGGRIIWAYDANFYTENSHLFK